MRPADEMTDRGSLAGRDEDLRSGPGNPDDDTAPGSPGAEPDLDVTVSEEDALLSLRSGRGSEGERSESALAAAIAQQIAKRLQHDSADLRIGTLAVFNDIVRFGGGLNAGGRGHPAADTVGAAGDLRQIGEEDFARHVPWFLPPPGFGAALEVLRERHLLVLPYPPGSGREAVAYNLLAEVVTMSTTEEAGVCYVINDPTVIGTPGWEPQHRNSGYVAVLDDTSASRSSAPMHLTADVIDERWVDETAAKVKAAESFMVVVTGPPRGALVETASRSGHVLLGLGTVDAVQIIERHVLGHDPDPDEAATLRSTLAAAGALALLDERPEPGIAASLAATIRAGEDLADRVRAFRDPTTQVHTWFSRRRDPEALCFALAAAALEGSGYLTVSDAAVELYRSLFRVADKFPDLRFQDQLASDHPWIEVYAKDDHGRAHLSGLARVRFRSPLMAQAVLGYAWTYLDGSRGGLQAWLRQLVTHPDIDVRARAAVAAGVIAWADHNHAVHRYLRSWAGHRSAVVRQAAATALDVVGGHPYLAEPVLALLESWASDEATSPFARRLAGTAATAVGGVLGARLPRRATEVLHMALRRPEWDALLPVAWSLVRLIEQDRISEVLSALLDWSQEQDASPLVTKGLSAFAFAVRQPAVESDGEPGDGAASRSVRIPALLMHATEHKPQIEELWARALARKPAQTQALDALHECLGTYADRDRMVLDGLTDILLNIAARPGRHSERLAYYLDQWVREGGHVSGPAAHIRAALARSET